MPPEPAWTSEQPRVAGWYWFRASRADEPNGAGYVSPPEMAEVVTVPVEAWPVCFQMEVRGRKVNWWRNRFSEWQGPLDAKGG